MNRSAAWVRTDSNLSTYRLKLKYCLHLRTKRKGTKRPDTDAKILKANKHKKSDKIAVGFRFASDWKRKWRELSGSIMESNEE